MAGAGDFSHGAAFVEGGYVAIAEARLSLLDWGFLRSDAVYDVVHVWKGNFFRLDDHLDRFERSLAAYRLAPAYQRDEIVAILSQCVRLSGLREAYVEMLCTRGVPPPGNRHPSACENRFYAFAIPFVWIADEQQRRDGLSLAISTVQRIPPESVDPRAKNYHWLDLTRALFEAQDAGAETCVLVDRAGNVVEGPGFNVFAVADGEVVTPGHGMLEGITRLTVLELCAEIGIACRADILAAARLRQADEAFIASTAGGLMPVTVIDGRRLGDGAPGPLTRRLHDLYWAKKEAGWHATPVDYR